MSAEPKVTQLAGKARVVGKMLGVSASTVRRLTRTDPDFPRPFRFSPRGDLVWPLAEIPVYVERKSGRQLAA